MSKAQVTFVPENRTIVVPVGVTIAEAAHQAGIAIVSPCAGAGTCGRCRVLLPDKGSVLACQEAITQDTVVEIPRTSRPGGLAVQLKATLSGHEQDAALDPLAKRTKLIIEPDSLANSRGWADRLLEELKQVTGLQDVHVSAAVLRDLVPANRNQAWHGIISHAVCYQGERVVAIESADLDGTESASTDTGRSCGLAIDIGTSTIAAELVDLETGDVLACVGCANTQAAFGSEVTRRIEHAEEDGVADLTTAILYDIHALIETALLADNVGSVQIQAVVVAGNTAMLHFLYGFDPSPIRRAPHIPLAMAPPIAAGSEIGLDSAPNARLYALPCIGGWVGGDITAGILATGLHRDDALTMMIDIGTNGEIVLGNREWLMTCAASAGPAFEGCGISCGTGAVPGAIDRCSIDEAGVVSWHTIDDAPAHGLCGSGLISTVASLFRAGLIDRAGRILAPDTTLDEPGIILVPARDSATRRSIAILQRDIGSVLTAKAAMFAAVQSLLVAAELSAADLKRLIVCGGFGSMLQVQDIITLGLIPDIPEHRITFAGNTALRGARDTLLHRKAWKDAHEIACKTAYIELLDQADYFEVFASAQFIPHTDLSLFPSVQAPTMRRS